MGLFDKSKKSKLEPVIYRFESPLSPDEIIQQLEVWDMAGYKFSNFRSLHKESKFDFKLMYNYMSILDVDGALYPIANNDKPKTQVKLIWLGEKELMNRYGYDDMGSTVILGIMGIMVVLLVNPLLEPVGIDLLGIIASLPAGRGFSFPLLCLGGIGIGVGIIGTYILNRTSRKFGKAIKAPSTNWEDFKVNITTRLTQLDQQAVGN